jgi:hypothetical protein
MSDSKYLLFSAYLRPDQITALKERADREGMPGVQVYIRRAIDLFLLDSSPYGTVKHSESPEAKEAA